MSEGNKLMIHEICVWYISMQDSYNLCKEDININIFRIGLVNELKKLYIHDSVIELMVKLQSNR